MTSINPKGRRIIYYTGKMARPLSFRVEYEANLFAKWFLESVRGIYPDLNEPAVRRYVKVVRTIKKRFHGWYDDRKPATALLANFGDRFNEVCPGIKFTPHPVASF